MTNEEALSEIQKMVYRNTDNFEMIISKSCYRTIIKALKKQIKKKPIYDKRIYNEYWYCPNCNEVVLAKLKDSPIENEYNHSHCGGCGQTLDWNEEM